MIGDADGETTKKVDVHINNPHIERYVTLLNSLKPTNGHWGVMLEPDRLRKHYKQKQITEDDYKFLMRYMFPEDTDENDDEEYLFDFYEGVRAEAEYSFLVIQGIELEYVDEFGDKHDTYFE